MLFNFFGVQITNYKIHRKRGVYSENWFNGNGMRRRHFRRSLAADLLREENIISDLLWEKHAAKEVKPTERCRQACWHLSVLYTHQPFGRALLSKYLTMLKAKRYENELYVQWNRWILLYCYCCQYMMTPLRPHMSTTLPSSTGYFFKKKSQYTSSFCSQWKMKEKKREIECDAMLTKL